MFKQGLPKRFTKPKGWLWGHFENARGATLRFGVSSPCEKPLAHIVYIEGLSEFAEKKFELAQDFNAMSCNFSVIDRHGQGKSTRYLGDEHKQHSQGNAHDIDDIIQYCRDHIPEGEPIILLGHSTGGLLALLALEKEPDLFKGAILVSPLTGIQSIAARDKEAFIASIPLPVVMRETYIPGGKPWYPRDSKDSPLKNRDFTSDPVRGAINDYWTKKDRALRTGSPTMGWVAEMCRSIVKVKDPAFLAKIKQPVLIFTAGQDKLVNNDPTFEIAKILPGAMLHHYGNGKHELLMETDDIRDDILKKTRNFLKNNI